MKTRPKAVTITAKLFGVNAFFFYVAVCLQVTFLILAPGYSPLILWVDLAIAVCFSVVTWGLWRMAGWSHMAGCILASIVIAAVAIRAWAVHRLWSDDFLPIRIENLPERAGTLFGFFLMLLWLGSPLYLLTRAHVISAFRGTETAAAVEPRGE